MNILVVNWQDRLNPLAGGAEVHLHEIFGRIVNWGHKVVLLTSGFRGAKREEILDGICIRRRGGRSDFNFHVPFCVKDILRQEKIDIIVEDLNKIPFFTPLYVKKPVFAILLHRFGKSIFSETILPFAMYVYMAESMVPVVYRHIPFDVISESTMEDLVDSGIAQDNVYIHYCGIDKNVYKPDKEGEKSFSITFVGRIKKYKSIDHLLYAIPDVLKSFPNLTIAIVGDGDDIPRLKKIASSLGLDEVVEFTGFVSTKKKVRILQTSEVVVNTSIREGWGLTVIESNACGAPVIAADSPGLRDSVKDGYSGLLYPYGDIDSLVGAIKKLLSHRELLKQMQKNAIEWSKRFDWGESAKGILELLERRIAGEI